MKKVGFKMNTIGIVCEYNPLHTGHQYQIDRIRKEYGADSTIVCAMSGNFVQRGAPAIFDKMTRAKAAILSGADLVLELPIQTVLSSAEGFAAGGIEILGAFCDTISFGVESLSQSQLFQIAEVLLSEEFSFELKPALAKGLSFPAARQAALAKLTGDIALSNPNDILGIEYCKAILAAGKRLEIFPIQRNGSYHAQELTAGLPSATAVRKAILNSEEWKNVVPAPAAELYQSAAVHTMKYAERAILYRLRTMTQDEFEALPHGSEGLWRRFMHAVQSSSNLDEIISATKTKRYTRTRIDRMLLCAFLGISAQQMREPAPYVRILAFNEKGRRLLSEKKDALPLLNLGEKSDDPYWFFEQRCSDLYDLFAATTNAPGSEKKSRVFYHRGISE